MRWSAAKGIGRLSERLPNDFSSQVLENVLHLFSIHAISGASVHDLPSTAEATWHGACLATAELSRRALVPPTQLPKLLDWLSQALYFDIRKGAHSIGSNVRDAAAYVIWALARAQDRSSFSPHAHQLAQNLVSVCLFDRDVSIRRAASAAFQEHVGRMVWQSLLHKRRTHSIFICGSGFVCSRYRCTQEDGLLFSEHTPQCIPYGGPTSS